MTSPGIPPSAHLGPVMLVLSRRRYWYISGTASDSFHAAHYKSLELAQEALDALAGNPLYPWRLEASDHLYAVYQRREDAESTLDALHHPSGWRIVEARSQ